MGMAEGEVLPISEEDREQYKDKIKVFVAEPTQGHIHYAAHENRMEFMAHLARLEATTNYKFFFGSVGRLFISYARELIAERCIDGGMDYILWIDDDMLVPRDTFERLVKHDVDIVSPLAYQRVPPYNPVMWRHKKDENGYLQFEQITEYKPNELMPVPEMGFGVVLMKVEALKKVPKPLFMNQVPVGEDIWFCYKANQVGIQCYMDTSFCVGHIGTPPIITEQQFLEYKKDKEIKLPQKVLAFDGLVGTEE